MCCQNEHLTALLNFTLYSSALLFLMAWHSGPSTSLYLEFQASIFSSNPFLKLQCHITHFLCFGWPHHFNLCVPNHNQFLSLTSLFQRITEDVCYWKDPFRDLVQTPMFCKNETSQQSTPDFSPSPRFHITSPIPFPQSYSLSLEHILLFI